MNPDQQPTNSDRGEVVEIGKRDRFDQMAEDFDDYLAIWDRNQDDERGRYEMVADFFRRQLDEGVEITEACKVIRELIVLAKTRIGCTECPEAESFLAKHSSEAKP